MNDSEPGVASRVWSGGAGLLGLIVVVASLAGCGLAGSPAPEPTPLEPVAATASPTASPTPGPPALPAAARGKSEQSAVAFVKHYIDVLNYAARTLDTQPITLLSTDGCKSCAAIVELLDGVRDGRGWIRGGEWTMREPQVLAQGRVSIVQVRAVVDHTEQRVMERVGGRVLHWKAGITVYAFDVVHGDKGWQIDAITK